MSNGEVVGGPMGRAVRARVFLGPRGFNAINTLVNYDEWAKKSYVNIEITNGNDTLYFYERKELVKLVKYIQAALDVEVIGAK